MSQFLRDFLPSLAILTMVYLFQSLLFRDLYGKKNLHVYRIGSRQVFYIHRTKCHIKYIKSIIKLFGSILTDVNMKLVDFEVSQHTV